MPPTTTATSPTPTKFQSKNTCTTKRRRRAMQYPDDISLADKLDALRNDQKVRDTYHGRAIADNELGGRFQGLSKASVTGSGPTTKYPRQPGTSPWAGDLVPNEPPLGFSVETQEPTVEG